MKYPPIDSKKMTVKQRAQFKKLYNDLFWVIFEGSKIETLTKDEADRLAWNCAYEVIANHLTTH